MKHHPSGLPTYSKLWMFWQAEIYVRLRELNEALREYVKFHDEGLEGFISAHSRAGNNDKTTTTTNNGKCKSR